MCFYKQESTFATAIISVSALMATITLAMSIRLKVVLNLRQYISSLILGSVVLSIISSIQYQTNDISSLFITALGVCIIVFSGINMRELIYATKIKDVDSIDKTKRSDYSESELITLYKLKIYEIIRRDDDSMLDRKYSLFFDYRINMIVDQSEMRSLDSDKFYSLYDFAGYCKDSGFDTSKMTKEDFEVFKMMII
jgi:hypothetical protein